jgi:hypothetical protein
MWTFLRTNYKVGRARANKFEEQRAQQWQVLVDARVSASETRKHLEEFTERGAPAEKLAELQKLIDDFDRMAKGAQDMLQLVNNERDRFHQDNRANISLFLSVAAFILSIIALVTR